jgi:beta-lactamase regulating signal transducer with metallopeptidase domain
MQSFLTALIECSIAMSVLILLFIAITPLLSKRYTAKWRYYTWLVIVIGLIIPFRPHLDTALIRIDIHSIPSYTQHRILDNSKTIGDNPIPTDTQWMLSDNVGTVADDNIQTGRVRQGLSVVPWYQWVGSLWAAGVAVFIAYHSIRHIRFLKMIKRWCEEVTDPQTMGILQCLQSNFEISKPVKLWVCSCITSPMMIGFITPVILLPSTNYPMDELAFILKHELVHFKRKDLWYKSLVFIATAIHWFNPFVYLMAREIAAQCEISCDAEVVKDIDRDGRQKYSETIIGVIKNQSRMQTAFSTNFYGGKKSMKNRILSIMDTTKKKTGIFILCLVLIATTGIGIAFASGANVSGDLKPLSRYGGAIITYYNSYATLEANVLRTLGKQIPGSKVNIKVISFPDYIDINGRKIDCYNRTEPYYAVKWNWKAKEDIDISKFEHKTMNIEGKNVIIAFSDKAAAYKDDEVIEKMLVNQITFELGYKDKDYDHQAFINELINRGVYVIQEVVTADHFGWRYSADQSCGILGSKILTKYDVKDQRTSIFMGKTKLQKNIDGNQGIQIGNSFTIKSGETLAMDIKETTDKMPKVNWAIVDVTIGKTIDWMPNVLSGYRFIYTPNENYKNHTFKVIMSTEGIEGDIVDLELFTYKTGQEKNSFYSENENIKNYFYERVNYDPDKNLLSFTIPKTMPDNCKFYLHVSGRTFMENSSDSVSFHRFEEESESFGWIKGKTYTCSVGSKNLDECVLDFGLIDKDGQEFLSTIYIYPDGTKKIECID